jgi:hypothetical protein
MYLGGDLIKQIRSFSGLYGGISKMFHFVIVRFDAGQNSWQIFLYLLQI